MNRQVLGGLVAVISLAIAGICVFPWWVEVCLGLIAGSGVAMVYPMPESVFAGNEDGKGFLDTAKTNPRLARAALVPTAIVAIVIVFSVAAEFHTLLKGRHIPFLFCVPAAVVGYLIASHALMVERVKG